MEGEANAVHPCKPGSTRHVEQHKEALIVAVTRVVFDMLERVSNPHPFLQEIQALCLILIYLCYNICLLADRLQIRRVN